MSLEKEMKIVRLEGDLQTASHQIAALRRALACAMCAVCSERLGDEDFETNDNELLVHKRCSP